MMISVTILTKNSSKHLRRVLSALNSFDEVVVYDTGSTDETTNIAKQFSNVSLHNGPFTGFGKTHNQASNLAKHDWILSIDSDEILTPELAQEVQKLSLNSNNVYSISRKNFYRGKWIQWCGWSPDRQIKLYNRTQTSYTQDEVHERVSSEKLQTISLKNPLLHYPYETTADFLQKMELYSTLFAEQYRGKRKASLPIALSKAFYTFFKCYILKRGFLGGAEGFIISWYNANTTFYKYLKLQELNNR